MDVETPNPDLPTTDKEVVPEKIEDEEIKEPSIHCELCDAEIVHKLAQALLPGLSTACVDITSGDLFRTPGSVAVDLRKEMVDYVTMRSETCVAESIILENVQDVEVSDHPYDIITDFIEDFAATKRNLFSRVSGWVLSEKREDKIDDFVQEMDDNGFWPLDRRAAIAQVLLKNVDFRSKFHCDVKFHSVEELALHVQNCGFRSLTCTNEGCIARFCASLADQHDSICPFKIITCEQKCSAFIMRREMDRHCITVCPMKLVNCPFYNLGCQSPVPYSLISQHCSESFDSHLLHILRSVHKDANEETLKHRRKLLEEASSLDHLRGLQNLRLLTKKIKEMDSKLGPLVVIEEAKDDDSNETEEMDNSNATGETKNPSSLTEKSNGASNVKEEKKDVPIETEEMKDALIATEETKDTSSVIQERDVVSSAIQERDVVSCAIEEKEDASKAAEDASMTTEEMKDTSNEKEETKDVDVSNEKEETKDVVDVSNEKEETKDVADVSNEKEETRDVDVSNEKEETKDVVDVSNEKEESKDVDVSNEKEETKDAVDVSNEKEETKDVYSSTEETKDASNTKEETNNASYAEEEMKDAADVKEKMNDASDLEEDKKDASDAMEEVKNARKETEETTEERNGLPNVKEETKGVSNLVRNDSDEAEK